MNPFEIVFNYEGLESVIQGYENDNIKDIFYKFLKKSSITQSNKFNCLYNGRVLNLDQGLRILEIANAEDKRKKN